MNGPEDRRDAPPLRTQIAIAIVEREGRFLVGERGAETSLAGLAEFPGGKVAIGETPEQAAARECLEETGLSVLVGVAEPVVEHDYAHDRVALHFFHCAPQDADREPRPPFRWVTRAGLFELAFPAANRGLLERLVAGEPPAGANG